MKQLLHQAAIGWWQKYWTTLVQEAVFGGAQGQQCWAQHNTRVAWITFLPSCSGTRFVSNTSISFACFVFAVERCECMEKG